MEARKAARRGHHTHRLEGSFRPITVHQLVLVWWLHTEGHLTKRQLRVWFALHEMDERRRYMGRDREACYETRELLHLIGGRSGGAREAKTRSELAGDLRALARLGLVTVTSTSIQFARSADQIPLSVVGDLSGFWTMLHKIDTPGRTVPVPRRMVRALAAGFSKACTALIFTTLIRCLFWHKATGSYRMDGRYKLAWVADVFGVSRRQLSEARTRLVELGWISPLEVSQWMLNRWGLHDLIDAAWDPSSTPDQDNRQHGESGGELSGDSACPSADFSGQSATPDLTDSLSLTGDQYTRNPARRRSGPSGVSLRSTSGGRKKTARQRGSGGGAPPNIRDIRPGDLSDTGRLLELHRQACTAGLASASEHGRLEFMALAERARTRGSKPAAMFYWLLRERKTAFITLADEDEAARRIREHNNGAPRRLIPEAPTQQRQAIPFSEEDKFVAAVLRVAQQSRIDDPFRVAQRIRPMTRSEWDAAHLGFHENQMKRWKPIDDPHELEVSL
ncbi:MAG: hypothetical protein AAFO89_00075 [Planctomycetota bacterium]